MEIQQKGEKKGKKTRKTRKKERKGKKNKKRGERKRKRRKNQPSLISCEVDKVDKFLAENGDTIEASASDNATPVSAAVSAAQSFAPSPHIPKLELDKLKKK